MPINPKKRLDDEKPAVYTDLALEAAEENNAGDVDGVKAQVYDKPIPGGTVKVTWIEIQNETGAAALERPIGNYVTVESEAMKSNDIIAHEAIIKIMVDLLASLKPVAAAKSILIAGLGNWNVTPDALGPRTVSKTLVTRHIDGLAALSGANVRDVSVISPGVMGITGIETCEIIKGVADRIKPDLVVAVDALAARRASRVNATIQLSDTGLRPGSGMGNVRKALNAEVLGVPVVAIGVPTVVDAATLVNDTLGLLLSEMTAALPEGSEFFETLRRLEEEEKYALIKQTLDPYVGNMFVTPKEVDAIIDRLSNIIANTLNITLHPGITKEDINRYMY